MKYIKKINEMSTDEMSIDEIIQELKDCFINIEDYVGKHKYGATTMFQNGISVKYHTKNFYFGRKTLGYNILCDFEVTIIPKFKNDGLRIQNAYAPKYTTFNDYVINEIEDSVHLAEGVLNLELSQAIVEYLSTSVGIPFVFFNKNSEKIHNIENDNKYDSLYLLQKSINKKWLYNINLLYVFLKVTKEKRRLVHLYYKKIK